MVDMARNELELQEALELQRRRRLAKQAGLTTTQRKRTPDEWFAIKLASFQQRLETGKFLLGNRHSQLKDPLVALCQELRERLRRWRNICTCERTCMKWLDWLREALAPLMRVLRKGERYRTQLVFNAAGYLRAQLEQRQLALP